MSRKRYGSMMDPVFVSDPVGPMTSSWIEPHEGKAFRMLTVIDEFTRRCLAIVVDRKLNSDTVLHCLTDLFVEHGQPDHIRSDNGPEFTANAVRNWRSRVGVKTMFIAPGSPRRTVTMRASTASSETRY